MSDSTRPPCYCGQHRESSGEAEALKCSTCGGYFHTSCLKSGKPSPLREDVFFLFTCQLCSKNNQEVLQRMKLPWLQVIILTLYNLQLTSTGKLGYFRWKEQICAFIQSHWTVFFGNKKRSTFSGTVAGVLSLYNNIHFKSGLDELHQTGWWKLIDKSPLNFFATDGHGMRKERSLTSSVAGSLSEAFSSEKALRDNGLRSRSKKSMIDAAIELKAKRDSPKLSKKKEKKSSSFGDCETRDETSRANSSTISLKYIAAEDYASEIADWSQMLNTNSSALDCMDNSSQMSRSTCISDSNWFTAKGLTVEDSVPEFLLNGDCSDENDNDYNNDDNIDLGEENPSACSSVDLLSSLNLSPYPLNKNNNGLFSGSQRLDFPTGYAEGLYDEYDRSDGDEDDDKNSCSLPSDDKSDSKVSYQARDRQQHEILDYGSSTTAQDCGSESEEYGSECKDTARSFKVKREQKRRRDLREVITEDHLQVKQPKLQYMSLYDEKLLLSKLLSLDDVIQPATNVYILRRKLLKRQLQREHNISVFNIDAYMSGLMPKHGTNSCHDSISRDQECGIPATDAEDKRILDRYQPQQSALRLDLYNYSGEDNQGMTFASRLMGTSDSQLSLIYSPYTTRLLKPFIRRDPEIRPPKLCLLQEIVAYPHRFDSTWKPRVSYPIDFCYVRPKHIPYANALCRQFFWPGIDLTDCLQYPDCSCVVLYRKLVIGFAVMVPDTAFNESYISFIFTHPEWRRAGIASFMLYHLIQTSAGKDITLHVSSSNPALLLYQKFGFKEEEFIIDFYDKYFPDDSKECRHAFFLRLRR